MLPSHDTKRENVQDSCSLQSVPGSFVGPNPRMALGTRFLHRARKKLGGWLQALPPPPFPPPRPPSASPVPRLSREPPRTQGQLNSDGSQFGYWYSEMILPAVLSYNRMALVENQQLERQIFSKNAGSYSLFGKRWRCESLKCCQGITAQSEVQPPWHEIPGIVGFWDTDTSSFAKPALHEMPRSLPQCTKMTHAGHFRPKHTLGF